MAETYEVTYLTEYYPNPDTPCWLIEARRPDGDTYRHIFPKATLAYRAAEYGVNPADTDTLIDIILHEPFAPSPDDQLTAGEDPAIAAGLMSPAIVSRGTVRAGDLRPTTLYSAATTDEAREAHLLRIQYAKTHTAKLVPAKGKPDPLAPLRAAAVDRDLVTAHAALVDQQRRRLQGERPTRKPDIVLDTTTAERLREATRA